MFPFSILTNLILPIFSVIINSLSFTKVEPQGSSRSIIFLILNSFRYSGYHAFSENFVGAIKVYGAAINGLGNEDVRLSKRLHLGRKFLRGFESGKVGPKDGVDYVGGNYASAINLNTTLPNIFQGNENIDLSLFFDAATLREVDYDSSLESSSIRSATGVAVNWFTVIGPLSFSYSIPLSSESSDKTESFRFRIGTSF